VCGRWANGAKGIEEQTRKLFEVCRLRDVPILTFVNQRDREGRDRFDLFGQIEQWLALDASAARPDSFLLNAIQWITSGL
jgi:peptide chain release factor 3